MLQQYEDHELTIAYNDGIRDGQIMATQAGYGQ